MKLQPARTDGLNIFTAYGDDYVSVNARRYQSSLIVLPDRLIENWTAADCDTLALIDITFLTELDAEILLLGTGNKIRFLQPELMQPLAQTGKGLDIMDIHAACRTYNVLVNEGRKVAAALIFS